MALTKAQAVDVGAFVVAVLLANALIFTTGVADTSVPAGAPPGWVIGVVWVVLFALMGVAHGLLRGPGPHRASARWWLRAYAAFCLAYPLYTGGFRNVEVGLAGNAATAVAAALLAWRLWPLSTVAARCVLPALPWLAYASWLTAGQLHPP